VRILRRRRAAGIGYLDGRTKEHYELSIRQWLDELEAMLAQRFERVEAELA